MILPDVEIEVKLADPFAANVILEVAPLTLKVNPVTGITCEECPDYQECEPDE